MPDSADRVLVAERRVGPLRRFWRSDWSKVILGDLLFAVLLGGALEYVADRSEEQRSARAERLEDLRFVRSLSGEVDRDRPFTSLDLRGQNLSGLRLAGADFRGRALNDTNLGATDLSGARFSCLLSLAGDFPVLCVDLGEAFLYGADLTGADLTGADMTDARVDNVDLTDADLTDADLTLT